MLYEVITREIGYLFGMYKKMANEFKKYGATAGEGPWLYENQELLKKARDLARNNFV